MSTPGIRSISAVSTARTPDIRSILAINTGKSPSIRSFKYFKYSKYTRHMRYTGSILCNPAKRRFQLFKTMTLFYLRET